MVLVLAILALVFAHITYEDVNTRRVLMRDLVILVVLRIALLVISLAGGALSGSESTLLVDPSSARLLSPDQLQSDGVTIASGDGASVLFAIAFDQWGIRSLMLSIAVALIVASFVAGIAYLTNRLTGKDGGAEESLGIGDVKLYAVCCLFLMVDQAFYMLVLSALLGAVMALYARIIKGSKTFPFAPAIVWSTFLVLLLDVAGVL